jgi:tetratricopeptide (TPR) repeat protein
MMTKRIFVSSTFTDLREFREAVQDAICQLGATDISMEHFGARDNRPTDECVKLIKEESDLFVGIYAHRYGHIPKGDKISILEAEYDAATAAGIKRLIYLIDETIAWPPANIDKARAATKLRKLKEKLKAAHVCDSFTNKDDLAKKVVADLGRHLSEEAEAEKESTTRAARSSLPHQPYFFGRDKELATIADALLPELRSWGVLIDGPGGIGKTALAIRAAYSAPEKDFPLKIFLSAKVRELTVAGEKPLQDFMLPNFIALISELAAELGLQDIARTPADDRANIVRRELADKQALIIIDNLETFLKPERDRLYQFLGRLPASCKAIVTSRRRADIDARVVRLDRLALSEALDLIAVLAESNRRLARTNEKQRSDLYEIAGGNPLLIKWIAGQLGREGSHCRTIAEAYEFIKSAPKDNNPLEYIFGDLLDTFTESETAVLAALAHFTQPARVEWIAELSNLARQAAETALEDLTDRALLISDEAEESEQKFLLPPVAAIFLRDKRPEAVAQTGNRLTDRVYALVMENGWDNYQGFPRLEAEYPTIAAALPLFLQGDNERLQEVCDALNSFLNFSGLWDERLSLSQQAEEKALAVDDFYNAGWRAYKTGWIYYLQQQAVGVMDCANRCNTHWQKASVGVQEKATVIRLRGIGHLMEKNCPAAIADYKEALALFRTLASESEDVAIVLNSLAVAKQESGDYIAAERDYREALRIAKKISYRDGIAFCTGNLAALALDHEDWPAAEALAREALSLTKDIGRLESEGTHCSILAKALARQGHPQDGLPYARRAVEIYSKLRLRELTDAQKTLKECEEGA